MVTGPGNFKSLFRASGIPTEGKNPTRLAEFSGDLPFGAQIELQMRGFPSWQPLMGRLSGFWAHRKRWRDSRLAVVLAIAIAPFSVVVANLVSPHMRVGDGSEYYALYLSWIATARPYLSPALASTYGEMLASKQIIGLHVPFDAFAKAVPHLLVGSTQDVNHFWFYSGLAALIGIVTPFGSLTDPTNAFIALHVLLALAATTIAFYLFRWAGLIAVTLILVASPAIWFANKVHTEYFTITLTSIAVLSLLGRRFTWSVLALALAATQNPSFAVGAVIIGLLWLTDFSPEADEARCRTCRIGKRHGHSASPLLFLEVRRFHSSAIRLRCDDGPLLRPPFLHLAFGS